jgi:excisionase family DNA binding protein
MSADKITILQLSIEQLRDLIQDVIREEIRGMANQTSPSDSDEMLTVKQAAEFLSLTQGTIYELRSKGELEFMKRSKRCYIFKSELINYLKQGRGKTNAEIAILADEYLNKKKNRGK